MRLGKRKGQGKNGANSFPVAEGPVFEKGAGKRGKKKNGGGRRFEKGGKGKHQRGLFPAICKTFVLKAEGKKNRLRLERGGRANAEKGGFFRLPKKAVCGNKPERGKKK